VSAVVGADDYVAIASLVHRYADAVVHRDASQWGECWAEDAHWALAPGRGVDGRQAIVELWLSAMGAYGSVVQTVQNGTAWYLHGAVDHAAGRWYINERFARVDGDRGILLAHYDDTYVRRADGWQFASRALTIHYRGPADLSAEFASTAEGLRARGASPDV